MFSIFFSSFFCSFLQVTVEENVEAQEENQEEERKKSLPPVWICPQQRPIPRETSKETSNKQQCNKKKICKE